jgi:hypothetical protein
MFLKVYCSRACSQRANAKRGIGATGERGRHRLKTGRFVTADGYVKVLIGDHPWPRRYHYMFEHVKLVEAFLGRRMRPDETIHHKDGNRQNNAAENLELIVREAHMSLHARRKRGMRA